MSDITEEDVMKYCYSRNLMLVTKESLEYMHRPIVIETMNKNAISIEWIRDRQYKIGWYSEEGKTITKLLKDWEQENEKSN